MKRRVTIKDVAQIAGVTHTTVSRVIHNDSRISEETKGRVRRAMTSLDYQPNLVARGLVQNRTQVIALISPEIAPHCLPIIKSVAESSAHKDYALMLFPTNTWIEESLSFEWVSQNWLVDGILVYNLIYHETVPPEIADMQSRNLPFAFINKFLDEPSVNSVGIDSDYAVLLAVEHLAGLGHRRIGMLFGNLTSADGMGRSLAFRNALKKLGLPYDERFTACGYWYEDKGEEAMAALLANRDDLPTAFFCANDSMAIGATRALRKKGLRVPEDVSLVGYDDSELGQAHDPPLTTIRPPLLNVGSRAVDLLLEIIKNPQAEPRQIRLTSQLIERASTAKPREL